MRKINNSNNNNSNKSMSMYEYERNTRSSTIQRVARRVYLPTHKLHDGAKIHALVRFVVRSITSQFVQVFRFV